MRDPYDDDSPVLLLLLESSALHLMMKYFAVEFI